MLVLILLTVGITGTLVGSAVLIGIGVEKMYDKKPYL